MYKTMFYRMGELDPDKSWIGNSGIGYANNFMPITGGYSPGPGLELLHHLTIEVDEVPVTVDGEFMGGIVYSNGLDLNIVFAVSGGSLGYKVYAKEIISEPSYSPVFDVTPVGWDQGSGNGDIIDKWGVQFTVFGADIYMTDGISGIFKKNADNAADTFIAISPSSGGVAPIPKVLAAHGGHLLVGDVELAAPHGSIPSGRSPNLIWYSKFDDAQTFGSILTTPQHKGTEFKFLYDTPGGITKIVPAGDVVFVFKEKAIYIGEGPPFRWNLMSSSIGTQFPNSTGFYNNGVYFMSDSGPAYVGRDGQIVLLLEGKAQRALIGTSSAFSE